MEFTRATVTLVENKAPCRHGPQMTFTKQVAVQEHVKVVIDCNAGTYSARVKTMGSMARTREGRTNLSEVCSTTCVADFA